MIDGNSSSYIGIRTFETAAVVDNGGTEYDYLFTTTNTQQWVFGQLGKEGDNSIIGDIIYIPLNTLAAARIRDAEHKSFDIRIKKSYGKEALPVHIIISAITKIEGVKKYWRRKITQIVNPHVSQISALDIYGFTVINNKFIEKGYVFSHKNRALKIMDVIDRTEDIYVSPSNNDEADELMELLDEYMKYNDKLERAYFLWEKVRKVIKTIDSYILEDDIETVENIGKEFINSITMLNNLK